MKRNNNYYFKNQGQESLCHFIDLEKANKDNKKTITIPVEEFIQEHKRLIKRLKTKKNLDKEIKIQEEELKKYQKEENLQKAVVRAHQRKTKTGKISQVREYVDKRTKKQKEGKKVEKKKVLNPWIKKYGHLKLNSYPPADEKNVEVNLEGDIHSHHILSWIDQKTGVRKHAYTDEFMRRNKEKKWQRIAKLNINIIKDIKEKTKKHLNGLDSEDSAGLYDNKMKQLAAIINIIANTGLRVGTERIYRRTKNRGVSTLAPENIIVKGDTVYFDFIGKSYQRNKAEIKDKDLANYLKDLKKEREGQEFLFDVNYKMIRRYFSRKLGYKNIKLKDMRTYVATDLARELLFNKKIEIDLKGLSMTKKKRLLKKVLKEVSEQVAEKLNNTPNIAKKAYIHPNVQLAWLNSLGVEEEIKDKLIKSVKENVPTLDDIIKMYPPKKEQVVIDEDDEELCDEYDYVSWFDEENEENIIKAIIKDKDAKKEKIRKVMREFKEGKLRSSSGKKVTSKKQAIAIALSEAGLSKKSVDDSENDFYYYIDIEE